MSDEIFWAAIIAVINKEMAVNRADDLIARLELRFCF